MANVQKARRRHDTLITKTDTPEFDGWFRQSGDMQPPPQIKTITALDSLPPAVSLPFSSSFQAKTQKAGGIIAGSSVVSQGQGLLAVPGFIKVIPSAKMAGLTPDKFPLFARPCPKVPRHGFVDSRIVNTLDQALDLYATAMSVDPEAELVLMQPLTGDCSAVATNAGVAWGLKNDGVTGGTSNKVRTIPCPVRPKTLIDNVGYHVVTHGADFMHQLIPNALYMELVEHNGHARLVQLRDGPEQPTTVDWITKPVVAQVVHYTAYTGDLLEWERLLTNSVKGVDDPASIVVCAEGQSLASHYCVHGIQLGMTVVTSHWVVPGEQLIPSVDRPVWASWHWEELRYQVHSHLQKVFIPHGQTFQNSICATAIATIHVCSQWGPEDHLFKLMAASVDALARMGLAACVGELRHGNDRQQDGFPWPRPLQRAIRGGQARNLIYEQFLMPMGAQDQLMYLDAAIDCFDPHRGWTGSYGGAAWARVCHATRDLIVAMNKFEGGSTKQMADQWAAIVMAANVLIHTSHNSGLCLTKWSNVEWISQCPTLGFMNTFAGHTVVSYGDNFVNWAHNNGKHGDNL